VGRFLTPDSLIPNPTASQSWNRYVYVENNPIRFTDPSGHCLFSFMGPNIGEGVVNCAQSINRTLQAYRSGERNVGRLASHVTGATGFLIDQSEAINQLNEDADTVFSNACFENRLLPSIRVGLWATDKAFFVVGVGQGLKAAIGKGRLFSNVEVRKWYLEQTKNIPELNKQWIKQGLSPQDRAMRAYKIRHDARLKAREMMADQEALAEIRARDLEKYGNPNGPTFEQLVIGAKEKGFSGDDVYEYIIDSSYRTDAATNKRLGLD
jgi:hypothetical protein